MSEHFSISPGNGESCSEDFKIVVEEDDFLESEIEEIVETSEHEVKVGSEEEIVKTSEHEVKVGSEKTASSEHESEKIPSNSSEKQCFQISSLSMVNVSNSSNSSNSQSKSLGVFYPTISDPSPSYQQPSTSYQLPSTSASTSAVFHYTPPKPLTITSCAFLRFVHLKFFVKRRLKE